MVMKKLCVLRVITSKIYDHNNNNVCQASTLSSEEITQIKPVLLNSKTWNVELSAFAIEQTFNM